MICEKYIELVLELIDDKMKRNYIKKRYIYVITTERKRIQRKLSTSLVHRKKTLSLKR